MNEIEYARNFLGTFKVKSDEIIPTLCPFCNGGDHQDKDTFALNMENHTFNCRRGSCGKSGHFSELLKSVGESFKGQTEYRSVKAYKKSATETKAPTDKVTAYLSARKINQDTAKAFGICSDGTGNMVFPFYRTADDKEQNTPTFLKFRKPEKLAPGERKMWREADTEPILYGLHLCNPERNTLYITEGEFDCMAVYQAIDGMVNVVSVPSGAQDFSWIETCQEELSQYKIIAVLGDNDSAGQKMISDLNTKFADKIVTKPDFKSYRAAKDANEMLYRYGPECIAEAMSSMKALPVEGLINFSDIRRVNLSDIPKTIIGIPSLDKAVGGFLEGDLSVWTGKTGEGKSSVINQLIIETIEQKKNVCVYSGEIPDYMLRYQIEVCAAGSNNINKYTDSQSNREMYSVSKSVQDQISAWCDGKLWVYDIKIVKADERESIMQLFTEAYTRYDCRVFIIDNLMTVTTGAKANEAMQIQADFVVNIRKFAMKYGVHVHMVVHPRKTKTVDDSDEVGGNSTITKIASNVINVHRCDEKEKNELNADSVITVLKNRMHGDRIDVLLNYNQGSRRYTEKYKEERKYSWDQPKWETVTESLEM